LEEASGAASEATRLYRLKCICIALLVVQNSLITLVARTSRVPVPGRAMYIGGSAVFASELVKMPVCLALIFKETGTPKATFKVLWEKVVRNWRDTLSMSIPALSYCFQNCLFFVAISNLSATSYQLWSQSKTLATAFFFVAYLGGVLCPLQWFALTLLTAGVGLVQFGDVATGTAAASGSAVLGVGAVILSSALSGFANVYLEKRVKKTDVSLWVRNVQLGVFSIPQAATILCLSEWSRIRSSGLFCGFTLTVWMVVLLKAFGGLLVASVIKYADNILKTYATASAIVLTCLLSVPLYGSMPSFSFVQGMLLVIASMVIYARPAPKSE